MLFFWTILNNLFVNFEVLHFITSLDSGGAEYMLFNVLNSNSEIRKNSTVYYFKDCGDIYKKLTNIKVPVKHIPLQSFKGILLSFLHCLKILASSRNSVLHLWMYHPSVIIGCLAKFLCIIKLFGPYIIRISMKNIIKNLHYL